MAHRPPSIVRRLLLQPAFGHFADHCVGRVEDVAEIVLDGLAHQQMGADGIQAILFLQPARHLGGGVLHTLIQRASVATGEDILFVFPARPTNPLALAQLDSELHIKRDLDACPDDLAVALGGVPIADVEERPRDKNREIDRHALDKTIVIHVAAMLRGSGRGDCLPARRGDAKTADHRVEGQCQVAQFGISRLGQSGSPGRAVDCPARQVGRARR